MADRPVVTTIINKDYLIEPLNGPAHPQSYLEHFPEEVYDTSFDSRLVQFLYALLGPAGAGWIKKNYFDVRTIFEEHGLQLDQLERFYGDPLRFGRSLEEIYDYETTGLLNRLESDEVAAKDSDYANRVKDFLHAARLGGTIDGISLAAKSATGSSMKVVENYNYMFDQHGDEVLNLERMGSTSLTGVDNINEFIIMPNREIDPNVIQIIKFKGGTPTSGYFKLTFNNATTNEIPQSSTAGTIAQTGYTVTGSGTSFTSNMLNGTFIVNGVPSKILNVNVAGQQLTVDKSQTIAGGANYTVIYGGLSAYATSLDVERALTSLLPIGPGNASVTGSMTSGFTIVFKDKLSNSAIDLITVESTLLDQSGQPVSAFVTKTFGDQPAFEISDVSYRERRLIDSAIDKIKPVNTVATYRLNQSFYENEIIKSTYGSSEYYEVVRYVTGNTGVEWPETDSVYWIEKGVEKQAPRIYGDLQQHYYAFHSPENIFAYSQATLSEASYLTNIQTAISNNLKENMSIFIGQFDQEYINLLFGRNVQNKNLGVFSVKDASRALAQFAEMPVVTTQSDYSGTPIANGVYPVGDKLQPVLESTLSYKAKDDFWASTARIANEIDYLEIDLGQPKAINFLTFDISRVPVNIVIDYDHIGNGSNREFISVTPEELFPFHNSIYFNSQKQGSPWESLAYNFTDNDENIIFTRYLRIKFTRRADQFLSNPDTPWPILIKNLRLGRNL